MPHPLVIAYHIMWTAYGTWLPNDPRGSTSQTLRADSLTELGEIHFGRKKFQPPRRDVRAVDRHDELEQPGPPQIAPPVNERAVFEPPCGIHGRHERAPNRRHVRRAAADNFDVRRAASACTCPRQRQRAAETKTVQLGRRHPILGRRAWS